MGAGLPLRHRATRPARRAVRGSAMSRIPSASQTVGPFFNFGLTSNASLGNLAGPGVEGERMRISFRVIDGDGTPTPGDAMIELWQADSAGRYPHPLDTLETGVYEAGAFHGFG